jgi:hypothetical protein
VSDLPFLAPGRLEPGPYRSRAFVAAFELELGDGWYGLQDELPDFVAIGKGAEGEETIALMYPSRFLGVLDPAREFIEDPTEQDLAPTPADYGGWLETHERFEVGAPVGVEVGGYEGVSFEATVKSGYETSGCPKPCVLVFAASNSAIYGSLQGYRERNIVLDVAGDQVLINISAPEATYDAFLQEAEEVLKTLRFSAPPDEPQPVETEAPATEPTETESEPTETDTEPAETETGSELPPFTVPPPPDAPLEA